MAKASTIITKEQFMKEIGVMINNMAMESKVGQIDPNMWGSTLMAKKKEKASSLGLMEIYMKASSRKTRFKASELTHGVILDSTRDIGRITR